MYMLYTTASTKYYEVFNTPDSMVDARVTKLSKKVSLYVVTHYHGDGTYFSDLTYAYNKNGLISKVKYKDKEQPKYENATTVYSYKKNRISKVVMKQTSLTEVNTPTYKDGKLKTLKWSSKDTESTEHGVKTFYYSKGHITKVKNLGHYDDGTGTAVDKYSYKNGLLVKYKDVTHDLTSAYKYDNKGYASYEGPVDQDGKVYAYYNNTYNTKGLLTAVNITKLENSEKAVPTDPVLKVTYKKIKVAKSLAKKVKAQQKWILVPSADGSIYNA